MSSPTLRDLLSDAIWVSESRIIGNPVNVHVGDGRFLVSWLGVLDKKRSD